MNVTMILDIIWLAATTAYIIISNKTIRKWSKAYDKLKDSNNELKERYEDQSKENSKITNENFFLKHSYCRREAYIEEMPWCFRVCYKGFKGVVIPVKIFPFFLSDSDDREYKRTCAEELVEMLNDEP